jgi:hypothetical protein
MKRTTIFVPEALERDLQLYAKRAGKPTAAVVRDALAAYITQQRPALPSFTGAFDSGHTDTAERHDEILFRDLLPSEPRRTARTRRAKRLIPRRPVRRRR